VFAGVRHKGAKVRTPRQKVSWSERRRRRNRPTVPTVAVPEPSLEEPFDLGSFGAPETIDATDELVDDSVSLDEVTFEDELLTIERSAPLIAGPSVAEGIEALLAVPLPKRTVANPAFSF
jgi:hypothetical protein